MSNATATKTPDFKIVREIVAVHGWTLRFFCPSYTIYTAPDGVTELTVWFFQSSGNLEGARLAATDANDPEVYRVLAEVKRSGMKTVLGWLAEA